MYEIGGFLNEISGAISQNKNFKNLYPHHAETFQEQSTKALIDFIALISISMLAVESYKKTKSEKDAFATAAGNLTVAFIIPNLFMSKAVDFMCKENCTEEMRVLVALLIIGVLYKLESPVVKSIRSLLDIPDRKSFQLSKKQIHKMSESAYKEIMKRMT